MKKFWWGVMVVALVTLTLLVSSCQGGVGPAGPAGAAGTPGPAGAAGVSTGTISGVVVDKAGKPVEKAAVVTEPATASATTDKDGKYSIKDVAAGQYTVTASAAGMNAAVLKVSVLAGKEASAKLTLTPAEPFPLGSVRAVAFRTFDFDEFPLKKVWLTLTKGYGTSNNNYIVTSGLNNVPAGTYVYLQGKASDQAGEKITAWSWKVTGPREKVVTVENSNTRQARFMADAEGRYEVALFVTKEKGVKADSSFEVFANRYVGVQNCATCHSGSVKPDKVTEWRETGHGTKFEDTFASYSGTSDYCIGCHVTGYNETDKAGGFDDAARQAGWDPAVGSVGAWIKTKSLTLDNIKDSAAGKFINIQCESCHGPGSIHEGVKLSKETGALYQPGVCSQCHPQEQQWRFSGHALTGSANLHTAEGTSCVACHTAQGFVTVKINGEPPIFPNMATADKPATLPDAGNMAPIACATCHDPHAFPEPFDKSTTTTPNIASLQLRLEGNVTMPNGVTVDAKESAVCVTCHADKRDLAYKAAYLAGKNTRGAHDDTQADVFYGVTSAVFDFGGAAYSSSPHSVAVKEGCISCHMAANPMAPTGAVADNKTVVLSSGNLKLITAGGHTWNMEGAYKNEKVENVAACTGCHSGLTTFNRPVYGDYDGNGKIEGVQTEIDGLLKLVAAQLPKDAAGAILSSIKPDNTTELQRQALWNYAVIKNDKSRGVHNTAFSVQVLQRTYKQLAGKDVPGATIR